MAPTALQHHCKAYTRTTPFTDFHPNLSKSPHLVPCAWPDHNLRSRPCVRTRVLTVFSLFALFFFHLIFYLPGRAGLGPCLLWPPGLPQQGGGGRSRSWAPTRLHLRPLRSGLDGEEVIMSARTSCSTLCLCVYTTAVYTSADRAAVRPVWSGD